jgi:Uma2 family endonuclease
MTVAPTLLQNDQSLLDQQHLVMDEVSWSFYEHVLGEVGDRPIRVTYCDGTIEIMSPLPEHEIVKKAIGWLLETLAVELNIPMLAFGSTTFRRKNKRVGLEPDECYYLHNADKVRGMKRFNPAVHPPPDLAIEIDVTSRSIARQPIYARLGVPEVWRFRRGKIQVLKLTREGKYRVVQASAAFPVLPMARFTEFVMRMFDEEQTSVVREFQAWVRELAKSS